MTHIITGSKGRGSNASTSSDAKTNISLTQEEVDAFSKAIKYILDNEHEIVLEKLLTHAIHSEIILRVCSLLDLNINSTEPVDIYSAFNSKKSRLLISTSKRDYYFSRVLSLVSGKPVFYINGTEIFHASNIVKAKMKEREQEIISRITSFNSCGQLKSFLNDFGEPENSQGDDSMNRKDMSVNIFKACLPDLNKIGIYLSHQVKILDEELIETLDILHALSLISPDKEEIFIMYIATINRLVQESKAKYISTKIKTFFADLKRVQFE